MSFEFQNFVLDDDGTKSFPELDGSTKASVKSVKRCENESAEKKDRNKDEEG